LKATAAALVLGVVAAGAIVSAQPLGGGRGEPSGTESKAPRPSPAVPGRGGNMIVDWIPADGVGGKKQITVDPTRHCIHVAKMSLTRNERLNDGAVRIDMERGKFYKVTASGEAFMSEHTGPDADPFAGVVVLYPTDEEDCYAERQIVLAPGKSITFRSPWLIDPSSDVTLMAFFIDTWPGHPKRGSYTLTIEETGDQDVTTRRALEFLRRAQQPDRSTTEFVIESLKAGSASNREMQDAAKKKQEDRDHPAPPARPDEKARDRAGSNP
jgi:hypothetical protein